jgi:hypothetical protein
MHVIIEAACYSGNCSTCCKRSPGWSIAALESLIVLRYRSTIVLFPQSNSRSKTMSLCNCQHEQCTLTSRSYRCCTLSQPCSYQGVSDEMTKNYIAVLKDCQRRFSKIPAYLEKQQWSEVTNELTRKAYVLRASMNALAVGSPNAIRAAKQ